MHECELCRRKWEYVRLIAVSLAATGRVTASCQGNGSRSHTYRCSNTINVIILKERDRKKCCHHSFHSAWINHIGTMNKIEQVPERFHAYHACSTAFNRSYKRVSKILAYVCHDKHFQSVFIEERRLNLSVIRLRNTQEKVYVLWCFWQVSTLSRSLCLYLHM